MRRPYVTGKQNVRDTIGPPADNAGRIITHFVWDRERKGAYRTGMYQRSHAHRTRYVHILIIGLQVRLYGICSANNLLTWSEAESSQKVRLRIRHLLDTGLMVKHRAL